MAWLPSNSFLENHPSLSEAGQSFADLDYIAETLGYPPSTVLPEPSALFTDNCFNDQLVHCPQPDRRAHVGLVGVGSHQSNYNNLNYSSIKSNRPKVLGVENVTGSSATWPQSLPSLSSTNDMGQMKNHFQVLECKSPGSTNPIGEYDVRAPSFLCEWRNCHQRFSSKGSVMRHLETKHVSPQSFKCSHRGCNRLFNRKDNRDEHSRRAHRENDFQ